jgi:hypothetical protein
MLMPEALGLGDARCLWVADFRAMMFLDFVFSNVDQCFLNFVFSIFEEGSEAADPTLTAQMSCSYDALKAFSILLGRPSLTNTKSASSASMLSKHAV